MMSNLNYKREQSLTLQGESTGRSRKWRPPHKIGVAAALDSLQTVKNAEDEQNRMSLGGWEGSLYQGMAGEGLFEGKQT